MLDILNEMIGALNVEQLAYAEDVREGLNRGRLIQGNPEFEKDPALNQTARFTGGIGLSIENLGEEIVKQGIIVTLNEKDFVTFQTLDVVLLDSRRIRRFYAEADGAQKLACGTNQDGQGAKGWSGAVCKTCPYHKNNFQGEKRDGCQGSIAALVYIPALDHTAILSFQGGSYMQASAWVDQVGKLSRAFAQRPEMQALSPGLARVNKWYFRTTLSTGPFEKDEDGNKFQRLQYSKAEQPYTWEKLLSGSAALKAAEIWKDIEPIWKQLYVDHNPNAVMSLPSAEAVAAIASQTSVPAPAGRQLESKVSVPAAPVGVPTPAVPVAIPTASPALPAIPVPAAAPAMAAIPTGPSIPVVSAPIVPQAAIPHAPMPGVAVSTIALDDADVQPVTIPTGF